MPRPPQPPHALQAVVALRGTGWPYVARLVDVDGRPAWAVDDAGTRYVVVGAIIFLSDDIQILGAAIRAAAQAAFARIDESYWPAAW
jgi:hypothetical protein